MHMAPSASRKLLCICMLWADFCPPSPEPRTYMETGSLPMQLAREEVTVELGGPLKLTGVPEYTSVTTDPSHGPLRTRVQGTSHATSPIPPTSPNTFLFCLEKLALEDKVTPSHRGK